MAIFIFPLTFLMSPHPFNFIILVLVEIIIETEVPVLPRLRFVAHVAKSYGRLRLIHSFWEHQSFPC